MEREHPYDGSMTMKSHDARAIRLMISLTSCSQAGAEIVWHVDEDGDVTNGCTSRTNAYPELQKGMSTALGAG